MHHPLWHRRSAKKIKKKKKKQQGMSLGFLGHLVEGDAKAFPGSLEGRHSGSSCLSLDIEISISIFAFKAK